MVSTTYSSIICTVLMCFLTCIADRKASPSIYTLAATAPSDEAMGSMAHVPASPLSVILIGKSICTLAGIWTVSDAYKPSYLLMPCSIKQSNPLPAQVKLASLKIPTTFRSGKPINSKYEFLCDNH